jgi:hypothetical protein
VVVFWDLPAGSAIDELLFRDPRQHDLRFSANGRAYHR